MPQMAPNFCVSYSGGELMKRLLLVAGVLGAIAAWAADIAPMNVKLGLWETTVSNAMRGMPPIPAEVLAKMTPEQRQRMEAAMAARAGSSGSPQTYKSCLTKEALEKALSFGDDRNHNCKRTLVSSSASKQDIHMECGNEKVTTTGDLHFEALTPEMVKGTLTLTSTGAGAGMGMNIKSEFSSKWLGPDCGDVGKK